MKKYLAILILVILMSGCIDKNKTVTSINTTLPTSEKIKISENKSSIEKISDELELLKSKNWNNLASQIGRPKATTLLWYYLKKKYNTDTKIVFGSPNKLDSSVAIIYNGENKPKIKIKGVDYYIIDPMVPEFLSKFNYGDMFDDPGVSGNYLVSNFRLSIEDFQIIKEWINDKGIKIEYSDLEIK